MTKQFTVYTSVKVTATDHPAFGMVGTVISATDPVLVKFDEGKELEINYDDLQGL